MSEAKNNLICAIDTGDIEKALLLARMLKGHVAALKLGLEFFTACGSDGVKRVVDLGVPVFLDLKFHDIPNTVSGCVREAVKLGVSMLTLHCSGGKEMLKKAVESANVTAVEYGVEAPLLLGVTILTSLDENDITDIGYKENINNTVLNLAGLANDVGLGGIVCSAHEIFAVSKAFKNLKLIVPGIRFGDDLSADQKRIMTPKQALSEGARYIVMGRSIVNYDQPLQRIDKYNLEL